MDVCAFTSVCEEDAFWLPQYLREAARLGVPFAIHFDRCGRAVKDLAVSHRLCVGATCQDDPAVEFDETAKQAVFDLTTRVGASWALAWDVDETFALDAPARLAEALALDADLIDVRWLNFWGDARHVRVDGPFGGGHRAKLYRLGGNRWRFLQRTVNGAYLVDGTGRPRLGCREARYHELVCLHHGMMTRGLREQHKARWDRIYGRAAGRNPYGFWNYALDEKNYPPVVVPYP